jgi:hypothetical protein
MLRVVVVMTAMAAAMEVMAAWQHPSLCPRALAALQE